MENDERAKNISLANQLIEAERQRRISVLDQNINAENLSRRQNRVKTEAIFQEELVFVLIGHSLYFRLKQSKRQMKYLEKSLKIMQIKP